MVEKGVKTGGYCWQVTFLWALTPPTPDVLHGGLGCSSAGPRGSLLAACCLGCSLPFFCFSPFPQGHLGRLEAWVDGPEVLLWSPGREGRVYSSVPRLLPALHLLVGRDFPKCRETPKGLGVGFLCLYRHTELHRGES